MEERRFMDFDDFARRMPLVEVLGMREVEPDESGATGLAMEPREDLLQSESVIHGGILSTLADTAAAWAVLRDQPMGETLTSIEFKLNFLRPARLEGGELLARGRVVRRGSRIAVIDGEVVQGGEAVARGLFTYLVLDADEE